jgi:hypothetical protein
MPESHDKNDEGGRFWFLLADALAIGYTGLIAPIPVIENSIVLKAASSLPGGLHTFGTLFAVMAVVLIIARFTSSRFLRVVHASSAGIYGLMTISVASAGFAGDHYLFGSAAHLACVMYLHIRAGIEQEPLVIQGEDSDG